MPRDGARVQVAAPHADLARVADEEPGLPQWRPKGPTMIPKK